MGALLALLTPLRLLNETLLAAGRAVGIVCVALMVAAILIQVFFRYVLGNALPWPDEAARFLMLWMTGLMAPMAFRRGGFVAIDMVVRALPLRLGAILSLALLCLSLLVLVVGFRIGANEVCGFGGRFDTVSLYVPDAGVRVNMAAICGFDIINAFSIAETRGWMKVPRWWMMLSIHVGVGLMILVCVELILRNLVSLLGGAHRLPVIRGAEMAGAE